MAEQKTIRAMAVAALKKWRRKNTPEAIAKRVDEVMDEHAERLAMAVLGFKWERWQREYQLDSYHDSVMRDTIRTWAKEAAEQWMAAHKAEIVSVVAPSLVKAMASRYRNVAKDTIACVVDETARAAAAEFAHEAIAQLFADEGMQISEQDLMVLFESAIASRGVT